ncbi:hypothetical protein GCM10010294_42880 [Streptomyces griseoloalbus]|uniref:hypothetical protein n=1 Tax=Streptomyces griseoloalbus TaxID=67303 RepID=UPI0018747A28|nr:hypothetical protein GCM10010294_42880 [Streptomyces griseoloalbus]
MAEPIHPTALRTDDSSALPMLPLPQVLGLTDEQRRGAVCVWCSKSLTAETARDLGERPTPGGTRIWPRGCTPCICAEARRVISIHSRSCRACGAGERCADRAALHALAREDRW